MSRLASRKSGCEAVTVTWLSGRPSNWNRPSAWVRAATPPIFCLFNDTVAANIAYGLKVRRTPKAETRRRVDEVATLLGGLLAFVLVK